MSGLVRNQITRVSGAQLTLASSNYVDTRPRSGNRRYRCDVTPGDFTCCGRAGENNRPATGSSSPGEDWVEKMIKSPRDQKCVCSRRSNLSPSTWLKTGGRSFSSMMNFSRSRSGLRSVEWAFSLRSVVGTELDGKMIFSGFGVS